ncbi:hypothetical protein IWX50DRAFT_299571 [Phyllosticta citricarpa]
MAARVGLGLIKLWPVWVLCDCPRRFKMGGRLRCLSSMQEVEVDEEEGCFGPPRRGVKLSRSPEEDNPMWPQTRRPGRALPASSSVHVWSASGGTWGGRSRCKPWKTRQGREEAECRGRAGEIRNREVGSDSKNVKDAGNRGVRCRRRERLAGRLVKVKLTSAGCRRSLGFPVHSCCCCAACRAPQGSPVHHPTTTTQHRHHHHSQEKKSLIDAARHSGNLSNPTLCL